MYLDEEPYDMCQLILIWIQTYRNTINVVKSLLFHGSSLQNHTQKYYMQNIPR